MTDEKATLSPTRRNFLKGAVALAGVAALPEFPRFLEPFQVRPDIKVLQIVFERSYDLSHDCDVLRICAYLSDTAQVPPRTFNDGTIDYTITDKRHVSALVDQVSTKEENQHLLDQMINMLQRDLVSRGARREDFVEALKARRSTRIGNIVVPHFA